MNHPSSLGIRPNLPVLLPGATGHSLRPGVTALAAVFALAGLQSAAAQVYQRTLNSTGSGVLAGPSIDTTGFSSVLITSTAPWTNAPLSGAELIQDISFGQARWAAYLDTTWVAPGATPGVPVPAALIGLDTGYSLQFRKFDTGNLTLQGVDLNTQNVYLQFVGTSNSLTLDNSRIRFGDGQKSRTTTLTSAPITISAAAGTTNHIGFLYNQIGAKATVNVPAGASLEFHNCGARDFSLPPEERLWFAQTDNAVLVDGGDLFIRDSYLIINNRDNPDGFVVTNGANLGIDGSQSVLEVNHLTVDQSSVTVGNNAYLTARAYPSEEISGTKLDMTGSALWVNNGAEATLSTLSFDGTSSVNIAGLGVVRAGSILGNSGATLNVTKLGTNTDTRLLNLYEERNFRGGMGLAGGNLVVGSGTTLGIGDPARVSGFDAILFNNGPTNLPAPRLTVAEGARMKIFGKAKLEPMVEPSPPVLDVQGRFLIEGRYTAVTGRGADFTSTIEDTSTNGTGRVDVTAAGELLCSIGISYNDTIVAEPAMRLHNLSTLVLNLNPAKLKNHRLVTRGEFLLGLTSATDEEEAEGMIEGYPDLQLTIREPEANDVVLPLGTKFMLVDYDPSHPPSGFGRFRSGTAGVGGLLFDGRIFQFGLNQYQIRYSDADYGAAHGGNDSVITLTVVPDYLAAGPDDLDRSTTTRVVKVLDATLLGNDTDPENDPLTIVGVANPQPAGATVTLSGNFVVYTAPAANAGNGSFEYTVSDGAGGHTATGQVTVHEVAPTGSGPNAAQVIQSGNDYQLTFIGVPGRNYRVEYTASTSAPYTWNDFSPPVILTASPGGVFKFTDINPPDPMRLYRAVLSP